MRQDDAAVLIFITLFVLRTRHSIVQNAGRGEHIILLLCALFWPCLLTTIRSLPLRTRILQSEAVRAANGAAPGRYRCGVSDCGLPAGWRPPPAGAGWPATTRHNAPRGFSCGLGPP